MLDFIISSKKSVLSRFPSLSNVHIKEIMSGSSIAFSIRMLDVMGGYIFAFVVSRIYGAKGMGIYSLSLSVLIILELLATLGFKTSVLRFVGQFSAQNSHYKIKSLYKNILELVIPVSIAVAIILYLFSEKISVSVFHNKLLIVPFRIVSVIIPICTIKSINVELIRGLKNIFFSEYLRNLNEPLFSIPLLLVMSFFWVNYYIPLIAFSFAALSTFLISSFYVSKKLKSFSKSLGESFSKAELLKVSSPMMITTFSFLIMARTDTIMIGMFSSAENVGIYEIALKFAAVTSFILYAVNTIAAPKFSELYWSGKIEDLKKVIRFSTKLIFGFSFPFLSIFVIFPKFFMGIFGSEFIVGRYALVFLAIGQFVNAASGSTGLFFNMTGRQHILRNIVLIATLLNIVLNYILIPKYGINGAAIATMVSISLWNIASSVYIKIKDNINTFYIPVICK